MLVLIIGLHSVYKKSVCLRVMITLAETIFSHVVGIFSFCKANIIGTCVLDDGDGTGGRLD